MIRGLAALEVCLGHLRAFFMVDYAQTSGGVAAKLFYLLTGLHHQAVMIFFVLSGFLVGGAVIRSNENGVWRWSDYLLRRLSRLWIVIVPALFLTLGWDLWGRHLNPAAYHGAYFSQLLSGPWPQLDHMTLKNFLGTLVFLQDVAVLPFGTNGPIKTLANEFWYYLLFPLGLQAVRRTTSRPARVFAVISVAAIFLLLPVTMLLYGLVWLLGVAAYLVFAHPMTPPMLLRWPVGMAGLLLAIVLFGAGGETSHARYLAIGAAFAVALPWLARSHVSSALYRRAGFILSETSYTLYLVHFPILAFIYFTFAAPDQWAFGAASVAGLAVILAVVLIYTAAIWWLFERNTDRVRALSARYMQNFGWRPNHA